MIKEVIINGVVFVEQRTFYVYENEEKRDADQYFISTSDEQQFNRLKRDEKSKRRNK